MKRKSFIWVLTLLAMCVVAISRCGCATIGTPSVYVKVGETVPVTSGAIGSSGGTISVTDASSPLNGLSITFPKDSVTSSTNITVGYADIDASGSSLPEETKPVSKMLVLGSDYKDPDGNPMEFDKPITITLPYDLTLATTNEFVNVYEYVTGSIGSKSDTKLEAASITSRNTGAGTMTFMVRHFSDYLILEWARKVADIMKTSSDFNTDTGFTADRDGWFIPNYGSILNPGGNCIGMSSYAKWFFTWRGLLIDLESLYGKYRQGDASKWQDDKCAIEAASRMQMGEIAIWGQSRTEMHAVGMSSLETAKSFVQAMRDTGQPQILFLEQAYDDGTYGGAHAVLIYAYSNGVFKIYDPNHPGDNGRNVTYTYGGNWGIYNSGTSAATNRFQYNNFGIVGTSLLHGFNDAYNIYQKAALDPCFKDGSLFPTVTLTSPTDTNNDNKLDVASTSEVGTELVGTITGGAKQPTHTIIYVNGTKYDTAIGGDGSFSQKIPLLCAETATTDSTINLESNDNVVEFLVTEANAWQNYAGFARYIISCTGPTPLGKVTLTWSRDADIDLHLTSPVTHTDVGFSGINYEAQTVNTLPYLDFDDTQFTGPEHMFFDSSLGSIEEGVYTVRVQAYDINGPSSVDYTIKVELGVMVDGVPLYDEPTYFAGTLTTDKEWQTVGTFTYPLAGGAAKHLTEGKQGI